MIKKHNSLIIHVFLLILFLFFTSCATNPVTGQTELMLVSEQSEIEIGKQAAPSVKWEFGGLYRDTTLESYLGNIVNQLWKNSERPNLPVEFHIQNTSIPNAFALPGYVAITRGLLSEMENEAQFASVIGHEIGHVMARHTAQRMSRIQLQQLGLAIGSAALGGKSGSDALLTMGAVGSSLLLLKYDRSQEIQADRLGVRYMSELGYDPYEALSAHRVLKKVVDGYLMRQGESRRGDNVITNLLSTHPRQEVRLAEIQSMIDSLPPYRVRGDGKFSGVFQDAIKKIKKTNEVYFIYDRAEKYYREEDFVRAESKVKEAISLNSSQAPFHNLLGFIKIRQKKYREAEKSLQRALSVNPGYQPSIYGMGFIRLEEGDYNQAIDKFRESLELYPNHGPTYFGLGKGYFNTHQYSKAIPYLRKFAQAAQRHPEVHGMLGICLEKSGDIASAVTAYRNQLAVAPDTELGRHARERLIILEPLLRG